MKKRVIFAAALTLTMCAGWSFSKSFTTESKLSELQIENVEAIANDSEDKTCTFNKVSKDEEKNELKCSGKGSQCCQMN